MPTVEMCQNCGCSEFAHYLDREEGQDYEEGTWSCDCGIVRSWCSSPSRWIRCASAGAWPKTTSATGPDHVWPTSTVVPSRRTARCSIASGAEVEEARSGCEPEITRAPRGLRTHLQLDWLDQPVECRCPRRRRRPDRPHGDGPPNPATGVRRPGGHERRHRDRSQQPRTGRLTAPQREPPENRGAGSLGVSTDPAFAGG